MEPAPKKNKMDCEKSFTCKEKNNGFTCKEEDACFKIFKSKEGLKRHIKCEHPSCRKPLFEPVKCINIGSYLHTQTESSMHVGIDIADRDTEAWYHYHRTKEEMLSDIQK